jgi:hypothetical protein
MFSGRDTYADGASTTGIILLRICILIAPRVFGEALERRDASSPNGQNPYRLTCLF